MSHKKSRTAYIQTGRMWLVAVFVILRVVDYFGYISCYDAHKRTIYAVIISSCVWSIALLTGIWFRQIWARITLITMLLVWLALGLAYLDFLHDFFGDKSTLVLVVGNAGYIASTLILIATPSIQKLTSRAYG